MQQIGSKHEYGCGLNKTSRVLLFYLEKWGREMDNEQVNTFERSQTLL